MPMGCFFIGIANFTKRKLNPHPIKIPIMILRYFLVSQHNMFGSE
jgi:hypothetical protein